MKIRNWISNYFTLLAGIVLIAVSGVAYYASASYRQTNFFTRLNERVTVTEQLFLEKERLSSAVYQEIRDKFLHTLPEEIELVGPLDELIGKATDSLAKELPSKFIAELQETGYSEFQQGSQQGVGRVYNEGGQQYGVIVMAMDRYGQEHIRNLLHILLIGLITGVLLMWIASRAVARHSLKPIARKIQKAQQIGASNLHLRLRVFNPKDELGQLALAFNNLLDRLETAFAWQKNFVRNASHELRNPLTAILGHAELVLNKPRSPEEYVAALTLIQQESKRLKMLVNNFLEFTQSDSNQAKSLQEVLRLDELLLEAKSTVNLTRPNNQIKFDFSQLPEDSLDLVVNGNGHLLQSAIVNLLDNACKFSEDKPVIITLSFTPTHTKVAIQDQGIGIPKNEHLLVFQPMHRAENSRSYQGSGIGLAIAQRVIEMHRGRIELTSKPGEGTLVTLILPNTKGLQQD